MFSLKYETLLKILIPEFDAVASLSIRGICFGW